ncbi:uncharacterized protein LOC128207889 isoform X1 [Mya arenaria]|uniref:uncharacterized protein LOC128207889 isoform X1 n=1 Tax=Mya arenaria TaxID=6604 RepID=UPI0022E6E036|nr:uncharacterized protein LOC128207889 isoform X1 [Mya arenaria]XP_052767032.1 uncharacterized protein LOC128207889 isoform X1 [Mya arenaria]XP_052767033.1 uncharacterized protein LOC128207889 isoform X1 [Mya arenaria]XP_052767034.1 uncharacterized protein LOC128207889 isoform X1 [Mya arenaria]
MGSRRSPYVRSTRHVGLGEGEPPHRESLTARGSSPGQVYGGMVHSLNPDDVSRERLSRLSLDLTRTRLGIYLGDHRSLSDSELNSSSMTSEFMELPKSLSDRYTPPLYHMDQNDLYLDLKQTSKPHSPPSVQQRLFSDLPQIELSNIEVIVDEVERERTEDGYLEGYTEYTGDRYQEPEGSSEWLQMTSLEPHPHMLLSPRSSNGSISSYRSSNADSAIEMLTPDEELPDSSSPLNDSGATSTDFKLWDCKEQSKSHDLNTPSICSSTLAQSEKHSFIPVNAMLSPSAQITAHSCSTSTPEIKSSLHSKPNYAFISSVSVSNKTSSRGRQPLENKGEFVNYSNRPTDIGINESKPDSVACCHVHQKLPHQSNSCEGEGPDPAQTQWGHGMRSIQSEPTIIPPAVVVSDFSSRPALNKCSQTSEEDFTAGYHGNLLMSPVGYQRSLSNSSISSESSLSIMSDSSQDLDDSDFPIRLRRKQSSWKKIRNIVRWTPFIQEFKRRKYPWIQLAGHQGNFQAGEPGAILKKYDKHEHQSFNKLMVDVLRSYVPEYRGEVVKDGECYLQLQDLLCEFEAACVMDVKMGCRTYLEDELTKARQKPTLRKDMYQKMVEVDPGAPTPEEHAQKAITKPRYMQWRDDMSSSTGMGFRIEGIRKSDGAQVKNFKTTKDRASVKTSLRQFVEEHPAVVTKYVRRLKAIKVTQESSPFFSSHEVIGSSLLFVHDRSGSASIWMIDFGKTVPLPSSVQVTHRKPWQEGNHEDGYLTGIDNLISIFQELLKDLNLPMASSDEEGLDSEASSVRSNSYSQFSDSVNRDSSRTLIQSSDTVTGSNSSQPES